MIKDGMIEELQELKLSGYSFPEARDELRRRHMKVPCEKTLSEYLTSLRLAISRFDTRRPNP